MGARRCDASPSFDWRKPSMNEAGDNDVFFPTYPETSWSVFPDEIKL